jgi:hypothetical protein
MVKAVGGVTSGITFSPTNSDLVQFNPSDGKKASPSPRDFAKAVFNNAKSFFNSENPITEVFNNLSKKYKFKVHELPSSLKESFVVLKNISNVLSELPISEKLNVKMQLKNAFETFYIQNLNLPDNVSAKAANRIAKALTQGPVALEKLELAVNKLPSAVNFGNEVLAILKSQVSSNPFLANQSSDNGRNQEELILHKAA